MDLKELPSLGRAQESHWYYAAKSAALLRCVTGTAPVRVLDVGAGSGFFARTLLRRTAATTATCIDTGYDREWSEVVDGKSLLFRRSISATDANLVLLMDVLEHVDADEAFLREYVQMVPAGARFIVSVPAFPWLWSAHDAFLDHRRRYTRSTLVSLLTRAGLRPSASFYFFGLVFPAAAIRRLGQRIGIGGREVGTDLREHAAWFNAVLRRLCLAEARVARYNRACGLTVFAVAEKPEAQGPRR